MKKLILIAGLLFAVALFVVFKLPPRQMTLKDLAPTITPTVNPTVNTTVAQTVTPHSTAGEPPARKINLIDSLVTDGDDKVLVDYYIIVESSRNPTMAKQKAEKLKNDFNRNFIVLPPTPQGYCRISCGKYSTLEEAKSTIESIRSTIRSDVWILSVKK